MCLEHDEKNSVRIESITISAITKTQMRHLTHRACKILQSDFPMKISFNYALDLC